MFDSLHPIRSGGPVPAEDSAGVRTETDDAGEGADNPLAVVERLFGLARDGPTGTVFEEAAR